MAQNVMIIKVNDEHLKQNQYNVKECAEKHWKLSEHRRENELDTVDYVIVMNNQKAIGEFKLKAWDLSDPKTHDSQYDRYHFELEESHDTNLEGCQFDYPQSYPVTIIPLEDLKSKLK